MKNLLLRFKPKSLNLSWIIKIALGLLLMTNLGYADCQLVPQTAEVLKQIEVTASQLTTGLKHYAPLSSSLPQPQLLVFLSFSMPAQSLKLWLTQTAKAQGQCLLLGFVENSLEKTHSKILNLFEQNSSQDTIAPLQIHPEAFEQFSIQQVPAVVITEAKPCVIEPCEKASFDVIYGNMSLEDALTTMVSRGSPEGKPRAKLFLQRYRAPHE